MEIQFNQVKPIPLKDKIEQRISGIWNTQVLFNNKIWLKIKAPSGTGKTTFTHIAYGIRNDYTGTVLWNNKNLQEINGSKIAEIRQQKVSVVFQDLRLFPNLTARENIELNRVLPTPYYTAEVIDKMALQLGVQHVLHQKAGICSYGEQQRIAIIRALIQPFELLLMDEPFSHLDNANTAIAANLIAEECAKRNAGFILTDLDEDQHFNYTHYLEL
jgi:putative ABC transport system ATP-binding protein